jgi:hypothetical protein
MCQAIKALSPITPPFTPDPDPVGTELMGKAWSFVPEVILLLNRGGCEYLGAPGFEMLHEGHRNDEQQADEGRG